MAYVLWGFCILLQKEVYTGEVLVQLQLDTGLDQTLIITESQILEMSTDVLTLHSSDPTFHYIKISSCFFNMQTLSSTNHTNTETTERAACFCTCNAETIF